MRASHRLIVLVIAAFLATAAAVPVAARSTDVRKSGTCTTAATWSLQGGSRDAQIRVEFEVDANVVGATWRVRLADNGTVFFKANRVTLAPSGSFTVTRKTADQLGTDRITARARNLATGEICSAALKVR